ncbi:MAG: cyclic di-GMP phosphodiesterase [Solirubrobacteraceae bacterium]|nr:cyclic di-GMP phosphodiesterase [Solirubrobacteraceae bacterium]
MSSALAPDRALVVDDDPQVRRLLARVVESEGYACDEAGTVVEARERLREHQPAIVLVDVHLPGASGVTLARELAAERPGVAVLMISGADDVEIARIAMDAGAHGYLLKPFRAAEVAIAIENVLRRRRAELESQRQRAALEDCVIERVASETDALARLRAAGEEATVRMTRVLELRIPERSVHTERMSRMCAVLAEAFELDPEQLRLASSLRDVGMIAVRDSILLKPGALSDAERDELERHAEIGYELLRQSTSDVLQLGAVIAWTHHERFDGSGYPRGLRGEELPLPGRIAGLADAFDALLTPRPDRAAVSLDEAVSAITAERGRQFDPEVVDAFCAARGAVEAIIEQLPVQATPTASVEPDAVPSAVVSLQDAATAVGVSPSTLRRWADEGRIAAVRTAGGHRRFPVDAVRRCAAEHRRREGVRPPSPPANPLPTLARCLRSEGYELAEQAARSLYHGVSPGWFSEPAALSALGDWIGSLARSAESGDYAPALEASQAILRRADMQAATLLERHGFLERFGHAAVRALSRTAAEQTELAGTRRLFAVLQLTQLARYG